MTPKQQALRDLEDARASLAHHASLAVDEWSPRALITRSVEKHRTLWIAAAAIVGAALLKFIWPSGEPHPKHGIFGAGSKKRGLFALLLSPLLALARKSVLDHGTQLFETYLRQKVSPNDTDAGTV
ncbi:hypothetical protein [Prosthecobacter sp.]|uniref:hypothetical protein n=1 Tax=Prosthecobacter sp. TaxID=1965333 RepID=UPI001DD4EE2E|nr:hypothetical protein [Prosthecobacter sp.]MCB1275770.1 hypothetical protein [Prosthecobacter sp.]